MSTITDLEEKIQNLESQLSAARRSLTDARIAACGVAVDDIVVSRGIEYRVIRIEPWPSGGVWLDGVARKKNGEWSNRERHLYGQWEKVL